MKNHLLIIGIALISFSLTAQNDVDVLRYSQTTVGGTARSIGYGGAISSLGADFSTLSVNPAGIGLYKKSELSITPTFFISNTESVMGENSSSGFKDNFNLNNYGLVWVNNTGNKEGWKTFQFGMGVNRTNNFNNYYHITNDNKYNSLMTDYQISAYGLENDELDEFSTLLAWNNWLLEDTIRQSNGLLSYTSPLSDGGVYQELKKTTSGSMNELNFAFGSSYNDILYIGGSVGFPIIRYNEFSEYKETDIKDTIIGFDRFILDESLETRGSGVNFKLGFIIRPTGFLRLSIAYNSPSYLYLEDNYKTVLSHFYDDSYIDKEESRDGKYKYQINTPMKLIGGLTFTIARFLVVSTDLDYINYSNGKLKSNSWDYFEENAEIRDKYKPTINARMGAEIRLRPISFRAGIARYGSPYQEDINDGHYWISSVGIGYRDRNIFFDAAFSYSKKTEDYYLYNPSIIDAANLTINNYKVALTVGSKF